ncbi:MAG: DNA cytosine methyltransferase [Candidatus Nanoarchaeia archaeon]|jgi:site-specific DNA-cytosine methylase|nr:DNA cytosine methyltransferase [Candidatus Nanoarchaeia archaeon]
MYSITHFIPLIGSFYLAQEKYNKEIKDELKYEYIFSFDGFKKNEQHLINNKKVNISYLDYNFINNSLSIEEYKKYIFDNKINFTDLMLAIPPCGGLSLLNSANRSAESKTNYFIFETVKWFIAQNNKILIMENAPGLIGKEGDKVLKKIQSIFEFNNVLDLYKINLIKVNTINYGLPQYRLRSFLIISKNSKSFLLKNYNQPIISIENYLRNLIVDQDDIHNVVLKNNYVKKLLKYIIYYNIIDKIKKENKDKSEYVISTWRYLLKEYDKNNDIFNDDLDIKEKAIYIKNKLLDNKGFWDISPSIIKGKINAICGKSVFNTINPISKEIRPFTIKELMYLMGMPNDFILENPIKNINHICQAIPVNTAKIAIQWAIDILNFNVDIQKINRFITVQDHTKIIKKGLF